MPRSWVVRATNMGPEPVVFWTGPAAGWGTVWRPSQDGSP